MKEIDDPAAIQIAGQRVSNRVVTHIAEASKDTGVSFSYLMAQAGKESSFASGADSHASSAAGLFQFTKGTWLQLVKLHGPKHGLAEMAAQIHRSPKGEYQVSDAKLRKQILDLRRDPHLAALMAGEYAKGNKAWLEKTLGRPVNSTDLYMAHFLGPGGAAKVLKAKAADPAQAAAQLLPQAAHLNPSVFYDADHLPRSVAAVYDRIHRAIEPPMKQYARLEGSATGDSGSAATHGHHHPHHGHHTQVASHAPEPQWPFETGQWPPAYVPSVASARPPSPAGDATLASDATEIVAYTDGSQSADQISAPMPPPPGAPDNAAGGPIGKLLKNLFG